MDWMEVINNSETKEEAQKKGRLLVKNMTVGGRWHVKVWGVRPVHGGKVVWDRVIWRHEIVSTIFSHLKIRVYPTTGGSTDDFGPRFAVDFSHDVDVPIQNWQDDKDPNKAVRKQLVALRKVLKREIAFNRKAVAKIVP